MDKFWAQRIYNLVQQNCNGCPEDGRSYCELCLEENEDSVGTCETFLILQYLKNFFLA